MMTESSERHAALKWVFDSFDANGDGVVSQHELDKALQACGSLLFEDEITAAMGEFDGDGIDFEAFCQLAEEHPAKNSFAAENIRKAIYQSFPDADSAGGQSGQKSAGGPHDGVERSAGGHHDGFGLFFDFFRDAAVAFDAFDEDGDGTLSQGEVAGVLHSLGHEPSDGALTAIIEVYDRNQNGALDFDEFCSLLTDRVCPPGVDAEVVGMISSAARDAATRVPCASR